jgi:uncharacterized protein (DUF2236 family)
MPRQFSRVAGHRELYPSPSATPTGAGSADNFPGSFEQDGVMARSPEFERYARDGALVLGGPAAILMQVADPVVASGVARHSAFADDPMRRLRHTLGYMYGITLGDESQARTAAGHVDRAHVGVAGATDPDRQLWVAATLYRLGVDVHELLHGPMPDALAEEIYVASESLGTALQVPPGLWPSDRPAFERYWMDAVAALEVGDDARGVARDLLHAERVPMWVRAGMPLGRTLTAGLLPASIRDAYGLPWRPRAFRRAVRVARLASRLTPRRLRELPSRRLLG